MLVPHGAHDNVADQSEANKWCTRTPHAAADDCTAATGANDTLTAGASR
jgi:hypothetical protein